MTHEAVKIADTTRRDALLSGYRPQPGVHDEMVDADGRLRPHWSKMVERLAAEGPQALAQRFSAADRHLKESGVYYRVYADTAGSERHWPLAHVPLLITPEEWKVIEAGAIQRARLIETLLVRCYDGRQGEGGVGHLPAALVAGSPDFLRPLVLSEGRVPRQLHIYAIDLCRSSTGAWRVLRDRTQAPSGAGYTLENRIAMSRSMSEMFREFEVQRLAPFFDALRAELASHREADDAGVCLLTPGPLNETYFEHSYLARYLGLRLVEGMDLLVLGGRVYLRTIGGLRKVCVLLRRIDGDFSDPLELNARSQLGVAGLVQAVRRGNVTLANGLGSGLAEARAWLAFLPALAEPVLGESLKLANVATWWCGQPAARQAVLDHLDERVIASALSRTSSMPSGGPWVVAEQGPAERAALAAAIQRRGADFVGQEVVKLSTMPVWNDGRLEPHPFTLRVFVTAVGDSYRVMPGGFVLIAPRDDPRAITMQRGARSADAWVMSNEPVESATLVPSEKQIVVRRGTGELPSRAADNLFWLARYIERAEATLRLIRALVARVPEQRGDGRPDVAGLGELLHRWGASPALPPGGDLRRTAETALLDQTLEGAVPTLVAAARRAAFVVRDRFPPDAWRALDDLHSYVVTAAAAGDATDSVLFDRANTALRIIAAVTGFQLENMNRLAGWRFLKLGLRIERSLATCRYVRQFARAGASSGQELDLLLELNDCQITYRSRYPLGAAFSPVMDLVMLDDSNPRSLLFQLSRLSGHAAALPLLPPSNRASPALAVADRLLATVAAFEPARIRADNILGLENGLMHLSDEISLSFFRVRDPVVADGRGA